jgi:hypothetical protein
MGIVSTNPHRHPQSPAARKPPPPPADQPPPEAHKEIGGPKGPEPTRYGDWEVNGRCTDF